MKGIYIIIIVAVSLALGYISGKKLTISNKIIEKYTDTLTVVKTDTIKQFYPKVSKITKIRKDTIYITDTIFITLPIESKEYKAEEYYAKISGYKANLDYIEVYPKETIKYITTTEKVYLKPKKWGLGVQLGAGVVIGDKIQFKPYVGVGLSYNFLTF